MDIDIAFVIRPSVLGFMVPFPELMLAAYVRKFDFRSVIIDASPIFKTSIDMKDHLFQEYLKFVKDGILMSKPKFIGLGCFTSDFDTIMFLAREIKSYHNCTLIVGNVHATLTPSDFIFPESPIDIAVMGEGELTLTEILEAEQLDVVTLRKIHGICFLDKGTGEVFRNATRNLIQDLAVLPMPAYDLIDMEYYIFPTKNIIGYVFYSVIPLFVGRGCPYKCKFCVTNTTWGKSGFRMRPIDNLIEEIKYLKEKYHIDAIYMQDDTFTAKKAQLKEFCEKISLINIVWATQTRVNLITEDQIRMMKSAGCMELTFGIESGSQKILDLMNKRTNLQQAEEAFALCRKYNIRTYANMMFNLPEETELDVQLSYKHYKKLRPDEFGLGLTVAYPGSAIYEEHFPKKLTKDEYYLLAEGRGDVKGRFRLSNHNLDFEELLVDFRTDIRLQHLVPGFMRMLFDWNYLKLIFNSYHRGGYITAIWRALPKGFLRIFGILAVNSSKVFPTVIKKPINRIALKFGKRFGNLT